MPWGKVSDEELAAAEMVVIETCLPPVAFAPLADLLWKRVLHPNARVVLYHDLALLWAALLNAQTCGPPPPPPASSPWSPPSPTSPSQPRPSQPPPPLPQPLPEPAPPQCPFHPLNSSEDRFATSWAPEAGFHFFCYRRNAAAAPSLTAFPRSMAAHLVATDNRRRLLEAATSSRSTSSSSTSSSSSASALVHAGKACAERCSVSPKESGEGSHRAGVGQGPWAEGGAAALEAALRLSRSADAPTAGAFPSGLKRQRGVLCASHGLPLP